MWSIYNEEFKCLAFRAVRTAQLLLHPNGMYTSYILPCWNKVSEVFCFWAYWKLLQMELTQFKHLLFTTSPLRDFFVLLDAQRT